MEIIKIGSLLSDIHISNPADINLLGNDITFILLKVNKFPRVLSLLLVSNPVKKSKLLACH